MRGAVNLLFVCAVVSMIGSLVHMNGKTTSEIQFSDESQGRRKSHIVASSVKVLKEDAIERYAETARDIDPTSKTDIITNLASAYLPGDEMALFMKEKTSTHQKRRETITKICETVPDLLVLPAASPKRMFDIPSLNLSLTLIAKVASTSLVTFLGRRVAPHCLDLIDAPRYVYIHYCVKEELNKTFNNHHEPVRATFVRNPWTRLVSVYEDKIKDQRVIQAQSCYDRWNITRKPYSTSNEDDSPKSNLSFSQFVTCILELSSEPDLLDAHWRPQYLMQGFCATNYTHIGHLEDIENDLKFILKSAQPSLSDQQLKGMLTQFRGGPRRPFETKSHSEKQTQFTNYYNSLSANAITKLQEIYHWDIALHGYNYHPLGP